jgi:hypothetical protein
MFMPLCFPQNAPSANPPGGRASIDFTVEAASASFSMYFMASVAPSIPWPLPMEEPHEIIGPQSIHDRIQNHYRAHQRRLLNAHLCGLDSILGLPVQLFLDM